MDWIGTLSLTLGGLSLLASLLILATIRQFVLEMRMMSQELDGNLASAIVKLQDRIDEIALELMGGIDPVNPIQAALASWLTSQAPPGASTIIDIAAEKPRDKSGQFTASDGDSVESS